MWNEGDLTKCKLDILHKSIHLVVMWLLYIPAPLAACQYQTITWTSLHSHPTPSHTLMLQGRDLQECETQTHTYVWLFSWFSGPNINRKVVNFIPKVHWTNSHLEKWQVHGCPYISPPLLLSKSQVHFQETFRDVFCISFKYHATEATQGASQRNVGEWPVNEIWHTY